MLTRASLRILFIALLLGACDAAAPSAPPKPRRVSVEVRLAGGGFGRVTAEPAGLDCGFTCKAVYSHGARVRLRAAPATGTTFTGWGGACRARAETCDLVLNESVVVSATFLQNALAPQTRMPRTLRVGVRGSTQGWVFSDPLGIDCPPACTLQGYEGEPVTLWASVGVNGQLTRWGGDCAGTSLHCVVMLDADKAVTATFDHLQCVVDADGDPANGCYAPPPPPPPPPPEDYTLWVAHTGPAIGAILSEPAGVDCGATCFMSVVAGSSVTLWASAGIHSQLTSWGGACAGSAGPSCTLTANADLIASADFGWVPCDADADGDPSNGCDVPPPPPTYAVIVSVAGDAPGAIVTDGGALCSGQCTWALPGGDFVFTAQPATTAVHAGWGGACAGAAGATCALTIGAPVWLSAAFTAAP